MISSVFFSFSTVEIGASVPSQYELNQRLSNAQVDSIVQSLSPVIIVKYLPENTTATDIVQWLLRVLGSFLTTLIMYFLHRWFPKIFPTAKIKPYISNSTRDIAEKP